LKTFIKLLIVAAIVNATVRAGLATWKYYQLKDSAEQIARFGAESSSTQLQLQIVERAAELELPVEEEDVTVRREGQRTIAEASYTQPIELFPSYEYPVTFSFSVDAYAVRPTTVDDVLP
jgi:hypothetical protein